LVNKERLRGRALPQSIHDLGDPKWKAEGALANPLYGTTTMHAAALFCVWGDSQAEAFFDRLRANEARIASSNGEVKRLVVAGEVTFGLTDTDDANEARKESQSIAMVYPDQDSFGTLVMPTAVVLMRGGPHPQPAERLVDFLLSAETERRMAAAAAHMPIRSAAQTPTGGQAVEQIKAMPVDYSELAATMERIQPWLRKWAGS
jgi:iron(III) transport system substrate-binding protein